MGACMCLCALCAHGGPKVPLDTLEPPGSLQKQRAASALTPGVTFPAPILTHFVENGKTPKNTGANQRFCPNPQNTCSFAAFKSSHKPAPQVSPPQVQDHPWLTESKTSLSRTGLCLKIHRPVDGWVGGWMGGWMDKQKENDNNNMY